VTSASAWADYLDARLRLIHEWGDEGLTSIRISERLCVDAVDCERILQTPTEPPLPGCSRDLVRTWRERAARLEAMVIEAEGRASTMPPEQPVYSQIQAIKRDPDPAICGCQYWHERPRAGEHHPHCEHFPKPESSR